MIIKKRISLTLEVESEVPPKWTEKLPTNTEVAEAFQEMIVKIVGAPDQKVLTITCDVEDIQ